MTSSTSPTPSIRVEQSRALVIGEELGRHLLVRIEAFSDDFLAIVGPMLELGTGGGGLYFKMVDLSSAFIGAAQDCTLDQ